MARGRSLPRSPGWTCPASTSSAARRRARDPRAAAARAGARSSSAAACSGSRPPAGYASAASHITVVHLADRLMEQQLDGRRRLAARPRAAGAAGSPVRTSARTETLTAGDGRVAAVVHEGGEELQPTSSWSPPVSAPRSTLARTPGLEVGRGVLVDDELRTSAPGVCAVGECAEHRGTVYGLWAPLLEQARAAGASLAGQPGRVPRRGARDDAEGRRHRALLRGPGHRAGRSPRRSSRSTRARALPQAVVARRAAAGRDPARRPRAMHGRCAG